MRTQKLFRRRSFVAFISILFAATTAWTAATITDDGIVNAVEHEILFDRAVPFNGIDVRSTDGIVTLTGSVDDLVARDRATELAEAIKGVRGVINRIAVEPRISPVADELASDVNAALLSDPATDSWEIDVAATSEGVVTLEGTVQSWHERELCIRVAKSIEGVTAVRSAIKIDYDADRPDYEIKPEVEKMLRWDALVDHGLIDVEVKDGTVILSGTVGSAAEKRLAESDSWVTGVHKVDGDQLKVARWARDEDLRTDKYVLKSDESIRSALSDALLYDPRVSSFNVQPRVVDGSVTLHGVVDNVKAKQAADDVARNIVGVNWVRNYLKVRPVQSVDDRRIERSLDQAVARDAWLGADEMEFTVDDGEVFLYGSVDWNFERERALDLAFRTNGVTDVHNYMVVRADSMSQQTPSPWLRYEPGVDYTAPMQSSDQAITEAIESQIWWSPFVDSEDVSIDVRNGVAVLSGTVDSWREYRAAAKNALEGGAVDVRNDLEVTFLR